MKFIVDESVSYAIADDHLPYSI